MRNRSVATHPDDELAIYIGSTLNLVARIAQPEENLLNGSSQLNFYRVVGRSRWSWKWRVIARFPNNTHQCYSSFLEAVMVLLAQSLDEGIPSWHVSKGPCLGILTAGTRHLSR